MFAILFSSKMDPIYSVIFAFPAIIFTFLLVFCVIYWIFAALGIMDLNVVDLDLPDADVDVDVGEAIAAPSVVAGVMMRYGLARIPVVITLTAFILFSWFFSIIGVYYSQKLLPGNFLQILSGGVLLPVAMYLGLWVTSKTLTPLKPVFEAMSATDEKVIIGRVGVVRSSRVDQSFGEANVDDGGAGLIVKVRAYHDEEFRKGDRVAILEHDLENNIYKVVSESEFNN